MEGDIFIRSNNKEQSNASENEANFFVHSEKSSNFFFNASKHLNDYDNNLLREDAYKSIKGSAFKLEYKILQTEERIKEIDKEILAAKDIKDFETEGTLQGRKLILEEELIKLTKQYKNSGLSAKISGGMNGRLRAKIDGMISFLLGIFETIMKKMPGDFLYFTELKSSLAKLENINKSVDELIAMKIPYGESNEKYDKLSKYIARANSIQSEISRHI